MGPELGEEGEYTDQQQAGEDRIAIQCAGVGQRPELLGAMDQAQQALLVEQGDHHHQRHAQQEVVEHRRQAANQPGGREVALRAQLVFGHGGLARADAKVTGMKKPA
ncbi:hypothetical protein D3C81_1567060 [compost metagenome]